MSKPTDVILALIREWAENTKFDRKDAILQNHAEDAVIFDVLPPLKYPDTAAYRNTWDDWIPETIGPAIFDLHELEISASENMAFAHALVHCGGIKPDGRNFEDWVRTTLCLQRRQGTWQIVHQHTSMPIFPT